MENCKKRDINLKMENCEKLNKYILKKGFKRRNRLEWTKAETERERKKERERER